MKKITLTAIMVFPICLLAQSNKVQTAWRNMEDYDKSTPKDVSYLLKAKDAIDLASAHEDTKNGAKTWFYRAKIYNFLFENNLNIERAKNASITDKNEKEFASYSTTNASFVVEAMNAVEKVKELDKDKSYLQQISFIQLNAPIHFENKGIGLYNNKNYADAVSTFENAILANKYLGKTDTSNLFKVAISADRAGMTEKTISSYEKLISMKYKANDCYNQIARIQLLKKDTVNALATIKKAKVDFPNDVNLMTIERDIFIKQGKTDDAITNLETNLKTDKTNGMLYFELGNLFESKANPKDANNKDLPKPTNFDELRSKAESNYKLAIEHLDETKNKQVASAAHYNLAALLYNTGNLWYSKNSKNLNEIKANEAKANEFYLKALAEFEASDKITPLEKNVLNEMKRLYTRTAQPDKAKAMDERIKAK